MKFSGLFKKILKSKTRYGRIEGYCVLVLIVGAIMLSAGIGLTIISPKGISAVLAMLGSLISFLATVALIFTWLAKENPIITVVSISFILSVIISILIMGTIGLFAYILMGIFTVVISAVLLSIYYIMSKK